MTQTGQTEQIDTEQTDKAGVAFWDKRWENQPIPQPVNPHKRHLGNQVYREFHRYFAQLFKKKETRGQKLLEIGCGRSRWLPYFALQFGFDVAGIDYSTVGCESAQAILEKAGVKGRIAQANFFDPPEDMLQTYDVVVSLGVVEHFTDTADCLQNFSRFLKPGGLMITLIPNMAGWVGEIQKRLDRAVYDVHVPLDDVDLAKAHEEAGLQVQRCDYLMAINWAVMSFSTHPTGPIFIMRLALIKAASMVFWFLERAGLRIKPNRKTSPYIICAARKKV
ncbi:MAG TPA: class I SAM-dependent methyltransferase [Abditibacteriaceae bacterium]|jgi:2-polyprenyl-3-methyl-5-hydroxy-6-metoxy-1,4-benzoquinol methylase